MRKNIYEFMMKEISSVKIANWEDIYNFVERFKDPDKNLSEKGTEYFSESFDGVAFLTFDYGIDGVSIEISKYAKSIELSRPKDNPPQIHLVGGDFHKESSSVIMPRWKKFRLFGANGWSKWDKGKWFKRLYLDKWNLNSKEPDILAGNIWSMTQSLIERLGHYINQNRIDLFIPVNIFSNPGNLSFSLAVIFASEFFSIPILNSNHDFYWEGGQPPSSRKPGESPGIRDHFFTNHDHDSFRKLFELIYPWDGRNTIQVNINKSQSKHLVESKGFNSDRIFELSTSLSERFFKENSKEEKTDARRRMMAILADGEDLIEPVQIDEALKKNDEWMRKQKPYVCGASKNISLDISKKIIYFLQPTRIIKRKRIEKDVELIGNLLNYKAFNEYFDNNSDINIFLHITGPVPVEHGDDIRSLLTSYKTMLESVDAKYKDRFFLGFSVGNEDHKSFSRRGFRRLSIEEIYSMANIVMFPSETEGRGLPIVESSAAGLPIVCSRYYPEEVFSDVIGENLDKSLQISYISFPDEKILEKTLKIITSYIINPSTLSGEIEHNRNAVSNRYGMESMKNSFILFQKKLEDIIKKES